MGARRDSAGFTLLEVMITTIVVVLALTGLVAMQLGTVKANTDVMNYNRALAYAEELMEQARQAEWRAPCTEGTTCDGSTVAKSVGSVTGQACKDATAPASVVGCPTPLACDTLVTWCGRTDVDVAPNSSANCTGDSFQQTCDNPPPNPTNITFTRRIEMEDISPPSGSTVTLRRVTVSVEWSDYISARRPSPMNVHRVVLETLRHRQ